MAELEGWTVNTALFLAPGISVNVPKLVEVVTLLITDVPLLVILPDARGVPADGRARTPDQVMALRQPPEEERVMEIVMVV